MERVSWGEKQSTIYLDIDGVILPYFHEDTYFDHNNPNHGLERKWVCGQEFYYPEVVQALGEVAAASLVILSSSRMGAFLHQPEYEELIDILQLRGALFIDHHQPGRIDYKQEAVYNHWLRYRPDELQDPVFQRGLAHEPDGRALGATGLRAVWIDDHIPHLSYKDIHPVATEGTIGLIAPEPTVGLTLHDVTRLAALID